MHFSFTHTLVFPSACAVFLFSTTSALFAQEPPKAVPDNERVRAIVQKMTVEDKISLLSGTGLFTTRAMPQYGIPSFYMTDGPLGARLPPPSTAYAAGIGLAASWDIELARAVGVQLARDSRSRGANFLLGPGVNLYRSPMNGRNFEYFGEDPYLASQIAVSYILGVQSQGVSATVKHFAGNNSEFARTTSNSVISERALRELYLAPFEAAVKEAHVGAVMNSYNLLNGYYTTQNRWLNVDVLRHDWGFTGILMSDWGSTHDGLAAASGGLDLEMPSGVYMTKKNLLPAIQEGKLPVSEIDWKVEHLLGTAERFGWLDRPVLDLNLPRYNLQGDAVSLRAAEEGLVLLKNEGPLLPLKASALRRVAVIGPTTFPGSPTAGGSGDVPTFTQTGILAGLAEGLRDQAEVTWSRGVPSLSLMSGQTAFHPAPGSPMPGVTVEVFDNPKLEGAPLEKRTELALSSGEMIGAHELESMVENLSIPQIMARFGQHDKNYSRWTGYLTVKEARPYTIFVQNSGSYRLLLDGQVLVDHSLLKRASLWHKETTLPRGDHKFEYEALTGADFSPPYFRVGAVPTEDLIQPEALALAKAADIVVLGLGFQADTESEGMDRTFALPPGQNELARTIAAINPRVVVVLTAGGSVDVTPWLERVPALVQTWYAGQEGGKALANVLLGRVDPSGRLPISWEHGLEENPTFANYYYNDAQKPQDIVYREGVFTGYRGFERAGVKPLFPFGFGLSYTRFQMSGLQVNPMHDGSFSASFTVKNAGETKGAAVPQIYLASPKGIEPEQPSKTLVAFTRVELAPGEKRRIVATIPARALTHFDKAKKQWFAPAGEYWVLLGESSASIAGEVPLRLEHAVELPLSAPVATATVTAR